MKIVVIGRGSVGEQHIRNLREMSSCRIAACDVSLDGLACIHDGHGGEDTRLYVQEVGVR